MFGKSFVRKELINEYNKINFPFFPPLNIRFDLTVNKAVNQP